MKLEPQFVEFIPEKLEDGKIYVSETYATAVHKCCCGCGQKVVTPLSPTGWRLTIDRGKVSLYPSIGNWNFPCRSHYWVKRNEIQWSYDFTQHEINAARRYDAKMKESYFGSKELPTDSPAETDERDREVSKLPKSAWQKLVKWLFG
jgi:hypothetical protein